MIYIIQVISLLFAIVLAKHDGPAITVFEDKGVTPKQMAVFHRYNNWLKFFFCLLAASVFYWEWLDMAIAGVLSFLWIYLAFDIFLNKERPGRSWDYLGSNDADGRMWIKWFGNGAGEWKAVILLLAIITINVLNVKILR